MESIKKILRTPSAFVLVIVALISLIGIIIQTNSSRNIALLPFNIASTQTAEAMQFVVTASPTAQQAIQIVAPLAVDSSKTWQQTGLNIASGSIVNIKVVGGQWTTSRDKISTEWKERLIGAENFYDGIQIWVNWQVESNGNGSASLICESASCPIPNFNRGVLIARIGNVMYSIGDSCSFTTTESGQIFFQANDDNLSNNAGVLAVMIDTNANDLAPKSEVCGTMYKK